jgi:hypothetical protein
MNIDLSVEMVVVILVVLFVLYNLYKKKENFKYEPKFGPKEFVVLKEPYYLNEEQRNLREKELTHQSPYERQFSTWQHRGDHGCRMKGASLKYHDMKKMQYIPGWPNVTDDWENIKVLPMEMLADQSQHPVLVKSDKMPVDEMLY